MQCKLGFENIRRIHRYLLAHTNKPIIFPKKHSTDHKVRGYWSKYNYSDFSFSADLAAIMNAGFDSDTTLHYSIGASAHLLLGTAFSWKIEKLFLPVNSTESEIITFASTVKKTKQFCTFFTNIGKLCSSRTLSYVDNLATSHATVAKKPTLRAKHINIPLAMLNQEYLLETIKPIHTPSRHMFLDFMTKAKP